MLTSGLCAEHEELKPTLDELQAAVKPELASYATLEGRTNALLSRYNEYVCPSHYCGSSEERSPAV